MLRGELWRPLTGHGRRADGPASRMRLPRTLWIPLLVVGVALAARAGFDPYGLVAVLQQLRTAAPDDALFALSLSTHPPAQTRLNQLEQAMGTRLDAYAGQPSVTVAQRMSGANRRPTAKK